MKYQLVIQLPADSISDHDALIEIEGELIDQLSDDVEVDGHDAGVGEMNIFIRTNSPRETFAELRGILSGRALWSDARIAFRELSGNDYTILWPKNLTVFRVS